MGPPGNYYYPENTALKTMMCRAAPVEKALLTKVILI